MTNTEATSQKLSSVAWLAGSGELHQLIRGYDWSRTPLGPIERWPQSLKTSVNLMLNSRHAMWLGWGPEITVLYNDAYIPVLGLSKHPTALGRPAQEVWQEVWDICGPLADKVFEKGEATFVDDVKFFMNRGDFLEEIYVSFSYSPIQDESGNVGGLFCPNTETTAKILNARRLKTLSELASNTLVQKSTEKACASTFATLAKNRDDIPFAELYLIDEQGRQTSLEQSTGSSEDIQSISPSVVDLHSSSKPLHFWKMDEVFRTSQPRIVSLNELRNVPSGPAGQRVSSAIVLPVRSPGQDRPVGIFIAGISPARKLDSEYRTFFDLVAGQIATAIQNARAAEEERKRAEALVEIDRAKTAFFSNVSHEFRTPLTLMLGPVEDLLAKSHTDLSPSAKGQLELVNRNGARLLRLVNTLLDFSRLEAGRIQANYQPTDLARFTQELASGFRSATEKAGLILELNCPPLAEPIYVDRSMWEKIVLNLISNAFKFTFDGKIGVALVLVGGEVELRVNDTGVGIPPEELPRLFDRFHRIENTRSRTHEGSGIGLALVQELVRLHGGSVRVQSKLNEGSTFIVSLPRGSAHLPAERLDAARTFASTAIGAAPFVEEALRWLPGKETDELEKEFPSAHELLSVPYSPDSPNLAASDKRARILVADDNADMRQYVSRLLSGRYDVEAVADGEVALAKIRQQAPDLVLSDVMMPNLDGFGLLRELRADEQTKTIPFVLLSARAGEESRVEGIEQGADDYLVKPFSARELLARVQTHIELARVRKENEESLRQHRERFDMVAEASQVGFWFCDLPFGQLIWDNRVKEHFWLPPEADVTIDTFYLRLHPEDRERTRNAIQDCIDNHGHFDIEYRTLSPDGQEKWIRAMGRAFYDASGTAKRFDGVTLETTERRRAEIALRQATDEAIAATAKFRAVFDQTSVFAGIMTLDGIVIDANQLCLEFCGYRVEEVVGKHFWETGWWRGSKELQDKIREGTKQAAHGTPYREVLNYYCADGSERVVEFALHPIRDQKGNILFLHPTGVDITDLKLAEEKYRKLAESLDAEVQERTRELEARNRDILRQSEQLRELSHRLMQIQDNERRHIARELHDSAGQLLTALGMNLARVAQQVRASNLSLEKEAETGQQLVRELSKEIRTTSYLLHPPLLDETGLADALTWYIQGLKERSGLDISVAISQDFGRLTHEMELAIFRIVQECLTNVHRHSGSKTANIRIDRDTQLVALEVQDEGNGIAPEKLVRLQTQGAGVGIRGMRERVLQLGGAMKIQSEGRGTCVSITLPIANENVGTSADLLQ